MSATKAIARLRALHKRVDAMDLAKLDEEAALLNALPKLLDAAEALEAALRALELYEVAHDQDAGTWSLATLNDAECMNVDAATKARAALEALSKTTGENNA